MSLKELWLPSTLHCVGERALTDTFGWSDKMNGISRIVAALHNPVFETDENALYRREAVSYTHLDVYKRQELSALAKSYDKDLWMSEITRGGGTHDDDSHESMWDVNTQSQSEGIMADLKYMQSSAWIAWLVADSEYECLQTNSSWGLLHAVFESDGPVADYHTKLVDGSGNAYNWIPEEGYWAVTKQFYTMMQYSKYLKAGYTMIDIDDDNMCAAIAPDGSELVIVAQNFGSDRTTTVAVSYTHLDVYKRQVYRGGQSVFICP